MSDTLILASSSQDGAAASRRIMPVKILGGGLKTNKFQFIAADGFFSTRTYAAEEGKKIL
jgi:hypothetical protein